MPTNEEKLTPTEKPLPDDPNEILDLLKISEEDRKALRKGALEFIVSVYARRMNYLRKIPLSMGNLAKLSKELKLVTEIRRKLDSHEKFDLEYFQKKYSLSPTRISAVAFVYADLILTSPDDIQEIRKEAVLAMRDAMRKAMKEGKYQTVATLATAILDATAPQAAGNAGVTTAGIPSPTDGFPSQSFIYADFRKLDPEALQTVVDRKLRELRATNTSR